MNELETSLTDVEDTNNFINGITGLNDYVPTFTSSPKKNQTYLANGDQSNVSRHTWFFPLKRFFDVFQHFNQEVTIDVCKR